MGTSRYEQDGPRVLSTAGRGETFAEIMARRLSRRGLLRSGAAASALVLAGPLAGRVAAQETGATPVPFPTMAAEGTPATGAAPRGLTFAAISPSTGADIVVAEGHTATPFLSWGTPLFPDAPEFDPTNLTAAAQAKQVGYNHDFVGYLPLPVDGKSSDHGLLVINHEYTNPELMFSQYLVPNPDYKEPAEGAESEVPEFIPNTNKDIIDVELEAHGITVVEIRRNDSGEWEVVLDSPYNRRLTGTTPVTLTGPAAGHKLVQTSADPTGTKVTGMLNNCSGGLTPWGTYVSCEENFNQYFGNLGDLPVDDAVRLIHERYGLPEAESERRWEDFVDRFKLPAEPKEPFRFGWAVEIDPYDAKSTPKKRTALGRFKHEAVNLVTTPSGKVALYAGDDERFEYVYKFVTAGTFDPNDRAANMDLLDDGTLYVAKFNDDGTGEWLPLVFGEGELTEANGFTSQGDILVDTRAAGDAVGATKMDRPEDIEHSPVSGRVYMVMTNNTSRGTEGEAAPDAANPRPENAFGHIIEVTEDGGDHAATRFTWDIFCLCGDPADAATYFAGFPKDQVSEIANPDNITFDMDGNLWISTDGQPSSLKINDGLYAVPVDGPERGYLRQFFSSVTGSEVSGPIFTPDNTTLFLSVQHPGEGGTYDEPTVHWPDAEGPPRPSLVVIRSDSGGRVGAAK